MDDRTVQPQILTSLETSGRARTETDHASVHFPGHKLEELVVLVQEGRLPPVKASGDPDLLAGDGLPGTEQPYVGRTDVRYHRQLRAGNTGENIHLSRVIDGHLENHEAMLGRDLEA